jgi:hypothetical protein
MSLGEAAQAVQVSAFPDRYADYEDEAEWILDRSPQAELIGTSGSGGGSDDDAFDPDPGKPLIAKDQDHDGLTDEFERLLGTDLHSRDSDRDGRSDLQESAIDHTDPLSRSGSGNTLAAADDAGGPGRETLIPRKALVAGFGGGATSDTDQDGISDLTEVQLGADPTRADTDRDGVKDGLEQRLGSSLTCIDSDHDGVVVWQELAKGTIVGEAPDADPGDDGGLDDVHV